MEKLNHDENEAMPEVRHNSEIEKAPTYNFKWMIALLLVCMAGSILFTSIKNKLPLNHIIFEEHFEIFPDPNSTSNVNKGGFSKEYLEAMSLYNQAQYSDAISLYSDISMNDPSVYEAQLYKAISQLKIGRIQDANQLLKTLHDSSSTISNSSKEATQWYLGLSHLRLGNYIETVKILDSLPTEHYKYEESKSIVQQLQLNI